jgi:predicted transcriptional regulator
MISAFTWNEQRSKAAVALAEGQTQQEVAAELKITDRTIRNWLAEPVFAAEVDRLSLMVGVASRAERLRLAMRVVRKKTTGETPETEKDLLEWLKFAQSETDGIKLDLTKLAAAIGEADSSLADSGQTRKPGEAEGETVH